MAHYFRRKFGRISRSGPVELHPFLALAIRFPDCLIVPLKLEGTDLLVYGMMRAVSLSIPAALSVVGHRVEPQLSALSSQDAVGAFQAAAARTNLGYLMIGGALAILSFWVMRHIADYYGLVFTNLDEILLWLILGQSTPILFGATSLLMRVLDRRLQLTMLNGLTSMCFLTIVFMATEIDAVTIAQTFAASQLTLAALCAVDLSRYGIWPGLTALFHSQIKIF